MLQRRLWAALLPAAISASLALTPLAYGKEWREPDESKLETHGYYTNRDGEQVHRPSRTKTGEAPEGATAQCRDQSYSFSRHRSGTCSGHGGVARWLR